MKYKEGIYEITQSVAILHNEPERRENKRTFRPNLLVFLVVVVLRGVAN